MVVDELKLYELTEEQLNQILGLPEESMAVYIHSLIEKFYPSVEAASDYYKLLFISYRSSFTTEKLYRNNNLFQKGFRIVYTKTGMIRDIINDLYYVEENLIQH